MTKLKYIISFDLWNTLLIKNSYREKRIEIICKYLSRQNDTYCKNDIINAYSSINLYLSWLRENTEYLYMPCIERLDYIINKKLRANVKRNILCNILSDFQKVVYENPPQLVDGAKEIIHFANEVSYLGLVSDTGFTTVKTIKHILSSYKLLDFFKYAIFSEEVGFNKPNVHMYMPIINNTYCIDKSRIIHIGDQINTDITIAKNVGIQAILFDINKKHCNNDYICGHSLKEILKILNDITKE